MRAKLIKTIASLLGLVVLHVSSSGQSGQKPTPPDSDDVVRVYSDLVQTDVMVFDKQGHFVNGLKQEDFELKIDGKSRPVEFFERIVAGSKSEETQLAAARGKAAPTSETATARPVPLDRGRLIFFYVDDLHMSAGSVLRMRKLLQNFVEQNLGQNDLAALTSASGTIGFLQQLSDNKAVMRAAIEKLTPRAGMNDLQRPPMTEYQALQIDRQDIDVTDVFVEALMREIPGLPPDLALNQVKSRASQMLYQAASNTTNSLAGLESLVRSSGKLPGRKLVFFISDGFFLDNNNGDAMYRLRKITSAAARSGVVIYSLDARGLVASLQDASTGAPSDPTGRLERGSGGELLASQDGMYALAKDTGGRALFNTNALDAGLNKALQETSTYYLLAWRPNHEAANDEKFRKLSVSLPGHPELSVRVRQGFFDREAPVPAKKSKTQPPAQPEQPLTARELAEAALRSSLNEPYPITELPVAANLGFLDVPGRGLRLTVSMQLSMDSLTFKEEDGKLKGEVDLRGVVFNAQGTAGSTFVDRLTIKASSSEQLQRSNKEIPYSYEVFLPPGIYQVRVGARDPASGKTGTDYLWIEVPNLAAHKLTLSSIFLGQRLATQTQSDGAAATNLGANFRADGRFERNSTLRFVLYIYNSALAANAKPDLGMQVQILRDGEPVITTPSTLVPTAGFAEFKQLPYGGDLTLAGLPPGRYVFQITIVDRVGKASATQQARIEIK